MIGCCACVFVRRLGQAFRSWLDYLDEQRRQLKLLKRALSGNLLRAWNQWLDVADEMRRLKQLGNRMVNQPAVAALRKWAEYVAENERLAKVRVRCGCRRAPALPLLVSAPSSHARLPPDSRTCARVN